MDAHTFNRQLNRLASDKRALEALYAEYALPMKAHLLRRFGSLVSAEDVTQDVFVKLLSLRDPPRVEYPASWLYTLADNRAKDILRATHPEAALEEGLAAPFDLDRTIVNAQTRRALEALDEDVRRILYLHFWEGYSLKEIAAESGMSYANVRVKVSRAYRKLKEIL